MSQISCWCSCMYVPDSYCCILHQWLLLLLMITEKRREQAINCMCICACTVVQIVAVTSFKLACVVKLTWQEMYNLTDIHMSNLLPYLMFNCWVHLNKLGCDNTHPNESTILASATEICIRVLFDTARPSFSSESKGAVQAATTISLRTPVESKDQTRYWLTIKPVLFIINQCTVATLCLVWIWKKRETVSLCTSHRHLLLCKWLLVECHETKTKVITLANHKGHRQSNKPIKIHSKYGKTCVSELWLVLALLQFWLAEKVAQVF